MNGNCQSSQILLHFLFASDFLICKGKNDGNFVAIAARI